MNLEPKTQPQAAGPEQLELLKERFAVLASHELRTPLAIARIAADLIKEGLPREGPTGQLWRRLDRGLGRLEETVEDLLLFARLQEARFAPRLAPTDGWALLHGAIEAERPVWEARGLRVEARCDGEGATVQADPGLLAAAFRHLVRNAVRFNRPGGRLVARGRVAAGRAGFWVADTGCGIPAGELPRVLSGFYQAADPLTREHGGLGLGLATVRRIADLHGGRLLVRSRPGEGSAFGLLFRRDAVLGGAQ